MDCYYCIVSTNEEPVADLCVLAAGDDAMALARARAMAEQVAGWERASVYAGERVVGLIWRAAETIELPLAA